MHVFFLLLVGLELKHYVADYLLQSGDILSGKGDWRAIGGYIHAGVHAILSAVVLLVAGVPVLALVGIVIAEFVVHFGLDYWKVRSGRDIDAAERPRLFWALYGLDQTAHQLTYVVMIFLAMLTKGLL